MAQVRLGATQHDSLLAFSQAFQPKARQEMGAGNESLGRQITKMKKPRSPVMPKMCATCPFRKDSPFAELVPLLAQSALTEASRICHSTATSAIKGRTGKAAKLCRGARDLQLEYFHHTGFIESATDEAWEKKCKQLGIP